MSDSQTKVMTNVELLKQDISYGHTYFYRLEYRDALLVAIK